ncbi:hypothetical protein [Alcanivorax sp.]|nr:hypothetical protein [Alcanivorax sp.]
MSYSKNSQPTKGEVKALGGKIFAMLTERQQSRSCDRSVDGHPARGEYDF